MKYFAIIAAAIALSGCMSPEVEAQAKQELESCKGSKTYVARAECFNAVQDKYEGAGNDLTAVQKAARLAYAEKVDKGQMSAADARLELAKIGSDLQSEQNRRTDAAWSAVQSTMPTTCNSHASYGYATTTCY